MHFIILPLHRRVTQIGPVAVLILVAILPFTNFSKANAGSKKETVEVSSRSTTTTGTKKREAWMEAGEYAKAHPAIGIAVYGRAPDATGEQVGKYIKKVFIKQGIESKYFLAKPEQEGVGVSFYLKDVAYGPTGLDEAGENIRTLITHFSQAWPGSITTTNAKKN